MIPLFRPRSNCYCAFCRSPRRVYKKKNISFMNFLASLMTSVVIMFALWQHFDPRALIVFVVCLAISEIFVQVRWRLSIACRQCGFDPVLYTRDHEAAAAKVKAHLERRKEQPQYLLSKPLNLPTISPAKSLALQNRDKKGTLLSRSL